MLYDTLKASQVARCSPVATHTAQSDASSWEACSLIQAGALQGGMNQAAAIWYSGTFGQANASPCQLSMLVSTSSPCTPQASQLPMT